MTQHFDYTEKEYNQKRVRRNLAGLFCALPLVVIVAAAFFVENAGVKIVLAVIGVALMLRLINVDYFPKQEAFKEVASRRLLILHLWQLANEFVEEGDGQVRFGSRQWSFRRVADGVIRLKIPDVGEYNVTPRGVEDVDDMHIDREEVKLIIHELEDRLAHIRQGQELESRTDPITGSTQTQSSEGMFRH